MNGSNSLKNIFFLSSSAVFSLLLAGCNALPPSGGQVQRDNSNAVMVELPEQFGSKQRFASKHNAAQQSGSAENAQSVEGESRALGGLDYLSDHWWLAWQDAQLNQLMQTGLNQNFSLQASAARMQQAAALYDQASSGKKPSLNYSLNHNKELNQMESRSSTGQLQLAYLLDLNGKVRAQSQQSEAAWMASQADYQSAALNLSLQLANQWYQLVAQQQQVNLLEGQFESRQQLLSLIEDRLRFGKVSATDLLQQQQQVSATEATLTLARGDLQILHTGMNLLLGSTPSMALIDSDTLLKANLQVPETLPELGLPLDLLERRPDLVAARWRISSQDANLAKRLAERYPDITLSITGSGMARNISGVFNDWLWQAAAAVSGSLYDGGQRSGAIQQARAEREQALVDYNQQILVALTEVEDALVQERSQRDYVALIDKQTELAKKVYDQRVLNYRNGRGSYIEVLQALTSWQDLQRNQLSSQLTLLLNRIQLIGALGGRLHERTEQTSN